MKAKMLKIAGVKTEAAFYKKYPTQEAFMKVHGKEFKKAQMGAMMDSNNNGIPDAVEDPYNLKALSDPIFGQTANYADTLNYNSQPVYLGAPPMADLEDMDLSPINPNYGKKQQRASALRDHAEQFDVVGEPLNKAELKSSMKDIKSPTSGNDGNPFENFNMTGIANVVGGAIGGFNALKAEKKLTDKLRTWKGVSGVTKDAAISNAFVQRQPNEYYRADELKNIRNINELYRSKGRGTDVYGQNGSFIGGNPTEVQNTYDEGITVYTDLEDPDDVKAYQTGGGFGSFMSKLNGGLGGNPMGGFMGNIGIGSAFNGLVGGAFGNNAGSQIGGSLGSIFGPAGSLVGTAIGGYLDKEPGKQRNAQNAINSNQGFINRINMGDAIHNQFSANVQNGGDIVAYEEGGYMNPEYNPQVITMFGDHNAKDFADYAHKFRAGGHLKEYTAPSERAMETYALGGKLQSHWGGEVEDVSYNPYLPGSGKTAMIRGASHNNGGVGISYNDMAQNGYAKGGANIEAEFNEPVMEMEDGGTIDPSTGKPGTSAVVFGNIPFTKKMVAASEDADLMELADKYDGITMKRMIDRLNKEEIAATKEQAKGLEIVDNAKATDKWGKLDEKTGEIIVNATDMKLQKIATQKMKSADFQNALHDLKTKISYEKGKNISAEALGKGQIKDDLDPITRDAPLENPYAKSGAFLKKAQNSATVPSTDGDITEEQYNDFVKKYESSKSTKGKANKDTLEFQRAYHKAFPKEALAAIQKTTKENGLSNKAKKMGLTKEDILAGKDVAKILQSNEDQYHGPRTDQYMASVRSHFNKAPDLKLNTLGATPPAAVTDTTKPGIGVVPLKNNNFIDIASMLSGAFQNDNMPPIDPRQFAGEYVAAAQNTPEPVPMQRSYSELDPIYRLSYQDVRNASTADFRDALRMNQFDPATAAAIYAKKAASDQTSYADEFRVNQALEQQIYGGNRAKMNQDRTTNLGLNLDQANKQSIVNSKTKEINQKIASSFADKNMKYDADVLKYNVQRNLFPKFGFDPSGRIHTQGAFFKPVIPQVYGGKSTIKQIPVYDTDGKTILRYEMQEVGDTATEAITPIKGVAAKNGKSIVKNAKNSSVVKAYKNL
jgi:hypothetical protein